MTDSSPTPNTEGEGYTQIILPTETLVAIGRALRDGEDLTQEQKNELLSAIMHELP